MSLAGGNPWKVVGTWVGESGEAASMAALRELRVLLGLRNSDDQGTNFDLRAEVLKNGTVVVSSADLYCLKGVTRNPSLAKLALLAFDRAPLTFSETDVVSVRVLTRIGTDGAGRSCGGHGSATVCGCILTRLPRMPGCAGPVHLSARRPPIACAVAWRPDHAAARVPKRPRLAHAARHGAEHETGTVRLRVMDNAKRAWPARPRFVAMPSIKAGWSPSAYRNR